MTTFDYKAKLQFAGDETKPKSKQGLMIQ